VCKHFVIISENEKIKFETNKFCWVLLNLCDDQKSSLNILVIINWKKLNIKIKEIISNNEILLYKCNIKEWFVKIEIYFLLELLY